MSSKLKSILINGVIAIICFAIAFGGEYVVARYMFVQQKVHECVTSTYALNDFSISGVDKNYENTITTSNNDPQLFIDMDCNYVENIEIDLNSGVGKDWILQVFYVNGDADFSESASVSKTIGESETSASINIGAEASKLRIDLGGEIGNTFCIENIIVNPSYEVETLKDYFSFFTALILALLFFTLAKGFIALSHYGKNDSCNESVFDAVFWIVSTICGFLFSILWLIFNGNGIQEYTDLVYETTAATDTNKSTERTLLYVMILIGMIAISLYRTWKRKKNLSNNRDNAIDEQKGILFAFITILATWYIYYTEVSAFLITVGTLMVFMYLTKKDQLLNALCLYILSVYAGIAIYRIYVVTGGRLSISSVMLEIIASLFAATLSLNKNCENMMNKTDSILQLFIPFSLLVLLQNQYFYDNDYVTVNVPLRIRLFVYIMVIAFVIEAFVAYKKNRNNSFSKIKITFGSLTSIMTINTFWGGGAIMPTDLHHSFENVIGFSQIFENGLIPYDEYISASGFYSVVTGAFFRLFGKSLVSNLNISNEIFFMFIAVLVILTMAMHVKREYVLLMSVFFSLGTYNRTVFIVPIVLLLTSSKLIERKNLWLKVWMLTSFFHGLYYPTYGAAVCIGLMPLGIWQVYRYIKSGELKNDIHKASFWIWWGVCVLPVALGLEILWKTFIHVKNMAGQTIYADGIVKFAQDVAGGCLTYLTNYPGLRMAIFIATAFAVPALFVWVGYNITLSVGNIRISERRIKMDDPMQACIMAVVPLILFIGYSFTIMRLDPGSLFARNHYLFVPVCMILATLALHYLEGRTRIAALCFAVAIPAMWGNIALHNIDNSCYASITVADGYIYIEDDQIEKWGTGFVDQGIYDSVNQQYDTLADDPEDATYFGTMPNFGYYYLCDIKSVSCMEIGLTIKSYDATKETVELLKRHPSIIGGHGDSFSGCYAFNNYYLYNWLMTSGEYIWSAERDAFLPNISGLSLEEVLEINKTVANVPEDFNIGVNANSVGSSYDSLKGIFSEPDVSYDDAVSDGNYVISFKDSIDGAEADYIYIAFDGMDSEPYYCWYYGGEVEVKTLLQELLLKKKYNKGMQVVAEWKDDNGESHRIRCDMNEGKLLIPLGSGLKWLLNKHDYLTFWVEQDGVKVSAPFNNLTEVKLLKLQEIE